MKKHIFFNSLFAKLLLSFLLVIIVLTVMNGSVLQIFKHQTKQRILQYNAVNLQTTVTQYERNWQEAVKTLVGDLLSNPTAVQLYREQKFDYYSAHKLYRSISEMVLLQQESYLENLIVIYSKHMMAVEIGGVKDARDMFDHHMIHQQYDYPSWEKYAGATHFFDILPAANFDSKRGDQLIKADKSLVPMLVKNHLYPQMYGIAFFDTQKMLNHYQTSINDRLMIVDGNGEIIFSNFDMSTELFAELLKADDYLEDGDRYFFHQKGEFSGLTYVHVVPSAWLSSEMKQINLFIAGMIFLSLLIGLTISFWFSRRFHQPVKSIVEALKSREALQLKDSGIMEFSLIGNRVLQIQQDLQSQQSRLASHAFANKARRIHDDFSALQDMQLIDEPFHILLFEIEYRQEFAEQIAQDEAKPIYYIREFIACQFDTWGERHLTFQVESNQVVSLIFATEDKQDYYEKLEGLKHIFDLDRDAYLITIVLGKQYRYFSEVSYAYERIRQIAAMRQLGLGTQILRDEEQQWQEIPYTFQQDQELHVFLQSGDITGIRKWTYKMIAYLERHQANARHYRDFSFSLVQRVNRSMLAQGLELEALYGVEEQLSECYEQNDYLHFFSRWLDSLQSICEKRKDDFDPILQEVFHYIQENYAAELTLERMAERLKLSSGYLSVYFKRKSGMNFLEYLNQVRIEKAKELLQLTELKVQEIGERVGYTSSNSFFRMFKKWTGLTPGDYRRQMHEQADGSRENS